MNNLRHPLLPHAPAHGDGLRPVVGPRRRGARAGPPRRAPLAGGDRRVDRRSGSSRALGEGPDRPPRTVPRAAGETLRENGKFRASSGLQPSGIGLSSTPFGNAPRFRPAWKPRAGSRQAGHGGRVCGSLLLNPHHDTLPGSSPSVPSAVQAAARLVRAAHPTDNRGVRPRSTRALDAGRIGPAGAADRGTDGIAILRREDAWRRAAFRRSVQRAVERRGPGAVAGREWLGTTFARSGGD